MGQRTNPLSLRVRGLINWRSNVRHPFLTKYIKHVFQHYIVSEPGIRASTSGIWINLTLLEQSGSSHRPARSHPLVVDPFINLRNTKVEEALGRHERIVKAFGHLPRFYYSKDIFANERDYTSFIEALKANDPKTGKPLGGAGTGTLAALHIYRDVPIHLKVNVISNPLLDATICADYVAKNLKKGASMTRIYKNLLARMG
ncbi:hypothetical protein HK104_004071 [Borealophlyctis nickersoniae]|nr:hypothetical protein HK104_004071 [Borealophlyctis nickersoniae]